MSSQGKDNQGYKIIIYYLIFDVIEGKKSLSQRSVWKLGLLTH